MNTIELIAELLRLDVQNLDILTEPEIEVWGLDRDNITEQLAKLARTHNQSFGEFVARQMIQNDIARHVIFDNETYIEGFHRVSPAIKRLDYLINTRDFNQPVCDYWLLTKSGMILDKDDL